MKKKVLILMACLCVSHGFGSTPVKSSSSTSSPQTKPAPPPQSVKPKNEANVKEYFKRKPDVSFYSQKPFGMPGVIANIEGKWVGSDYLGHLSKNIGIEVEIIQSESGKITLSEAPLRETAQNLFKKEGVNPNPFYIEGSPPLPFIHLLITLYPEIEDKLVYSISGRLFENVKVLRENFIPSGYWQAITWETQVVGVSKKTQLESQVKTSLEEVIGSFLKRYNEYNPKGF